MKKSDKIFLLKIMIKNDEKMKKKCEKKFLSE